MFWGTSIEKVNSGQIRFRMSKNPEKNAPPPKQGRKPGKRRNRTVDVGDSNLSPKQVGKRIAQVREERGVTLDALGKKLVPEKSKQALKKWESGDVHLTTGQLLEVSRALSVHPNFIMYGQGTTDVFISPLRVVMTASFPVQVIEHKGRETGIPRFVHVHEQPDPSSRGVEVIDDSMAPEFWIGDVTIFAEKTPIPGSRVWALWKGDMVLRVYTVDPADQMKGRFNRFTLLALKEGIPPIPGDEAEILGVVVWNARDYGKAQTDG